MNTILKKLQLTGILLSMCICIIVPTQAQENNNRYAIIPIPVSLEPAEGNFTLTQNTTVAVQNNETLLKHADYFVKMISPATGFNLTPQVGERGDILMMINQQKDRKLGNEGYTLTVTPSKVVIQANEAAGIFYGIQTLLQLLPEEIESDTLKKGVNWQIPAVTITDYPRFQWRGVMLDVSRHFFPKEYVKEFIDQIARYKFNRFHWHLTDDNGWRIEIKSYPKLTGVGAWRVPRFGTWNTHEPPGPGEKATDGGFYTQEDIKEIVRYARERHIEILPEIDVPGHSMAAVASYPELSCTQDTTIKVNPGSKFVTWHGNGKFTMHIDNTLDPSNEKVYEFLDKVFTEVASLFPYDYIHMGGDECYKGYWEQDSDCQALMEKMEMENVSELQSYFNKRVNEIIKSKGKKMIGWDEILEGGLPPGATVMSWRGMKGGIEAAHQNAPVIMTPSPMCYVDLYQGDPAVEPPTYSMSRLRDSYGWDPLPQGVDPELILGGQGNLWTEQIATPPQAEYMAYPRVFALSEVYWSPKENKNWGGFVSRVEQHFKRFDQGALNYSRSMYDPIIKVEKNEEGLLVVEMTTEVAGLDIYYTLNSAVPNHHYSKYHKPIIFPEGTDMFRVITYRHGEPVGKIISIPFEELEERVK